MGNIPKPKRRTTNDTSGKKVQTGKAIVKKPVKVIPKVRQSQVPWSNQYGDSKTWGKK